MSETLSCSPGANLRYVQKQPGHSNPQVTLDTYSNRIEEEAPADTIRAGIQDGEEDVKNGNNASTDGNEGDDGKL